MWDINIFEEFGVRKENRILPIFVAIAGIASILIVVLLITFNNYEQIKTLEYKINLQTSVNESDESKRILAELSKVNRERSFKENYTIVLGNINSYVNEKKIIDDELLQTIFSSIPKGVNFNSIGINGGEIQMECVSNDVILVGDFLFNLKKLEVIEGVYSPGLSEKEDGTYSFSVVCKVKDVKQNEKVN